MLKPSDFNNAVPQFQNGNYASNPINPQYVEEPSSTDYNRGTEPLQTLPAQWWNWFMNKFTSRFNKVNIYVKNLFNELAQLLSLVNVTPDGTEGDVTDGQLKNAFKELYPDYINTKLALESTYVKKTQKVNNHALSGDVTVTKSDVGLGDVVNTGDSATPTENGTTKFTTGGAYSNTYARKYFNNTNVSSTTLYKFTNLYSTTLAHNTNVFVLTAGYNENVILSAGTYYSSGLKYTSIKAIRQPSNTSTNKIKLYYNTTTGEIIVSISAYTYFSINQIGGGSRSTLDNVTVESIPEGFTECAITNIQTELTFDSIPTQGSSNPVTSNGVESAIKSATSQFSSQYASWSKKSAFYTTGVTAKYIKIISAPTNSVSRYINMLANRIDSTTDIQSLSQNWRNNVIRSTFSRHSKSLTTERGDEAPSIYASYLIEDANHDLWIYIASYTSVVIELWSNSNEDITGVEGTPQETYVIDGYSYKDDRLVNDVTENSQWGVTSGGVYTELAKKVDKTTAYSFFGGNTNSKTWLTKLFSRTIGNSWTDSLDVETSGTQNGVAYGNGVWVIASERGTFWSENLTNWTAITGVGSGSNSIEFKDGIFVLGTSHTGVWWSENGKSYTLATGISNSITVNIRHVGELWFASSDNNAWWSENGKSWTSCVGTANGISLSVLDYGDGKYFAAKNNNTNLMTSNDGKSWSAVTSSYFDKRVTAIKYAKGVWFVGTDRDTYDNNLFTSKDGGTTWNVENIVNDSSMYVMNIQITGNIAIITYYDPNRSATTFIVTFGLTKENSCIIKSTKIEAFALNSLVKIYGTYFAVTLSGGLMRSTDLLIWEDTFVKAESFGLNKLLFADNKLLYTSLAGGAQFSEIDLNAI